MKMWEEVGNSIPFTAAKAGLPLMKTCGVHGVYLSFLGVSGNHTGCSHCADSAAGKSLQPIGVKRPERFSLTVDIPKQLMEASFATFLPKMPSHAVMLSYVQSVTKQWMAGELEQCGQLVFLGERNSGKSHVALSVLRSLSVEHSVFYADAGRGVFDVTDESYVLVLDNLFCGAKPLSTKAIMHWNQVLYKRAVMQLPTIIVSNQGLADFRRYLRPRSLHWMRISKAQVVNFGA